MKIKTLLIAIFSLCSLAAFAQVGGVKGQVLSREGRSAVGEVKVTIEGTEISALTDKSGNFTFQNLPAGDYNLRFEAADYESLNIPIRIDRGIKNLPATIIVPAAIQEVDDSIFAELDNDSSASDTSALPSSLSSSKDLYNNIASYKFSEMRFNVRGYDSGYSDIFLNGIRFNDAMTGYGPWSLWSGMNDVTRSQENLPANSLSDYGIGGIGGATNIFARASQMQKGFRLSIANGDSMYRLRAMISYASGMTDKGWSYAFSFSTRQGGNEYVDGVYYNSYGYFASIEKKFGTRHQLGLMILGTPQERGAQQASTDEAYQLWGDNYYNPNVGRQNGKDRNTRVRNSHEPIAMLTYYFDISDRTRLSVATSVRFGFNGYSALTWKDGADPRPDYYRYLPSYYTNYIIGQAIPGVFETVTSDANRNEYLFLASQTALNWDGRMDFDNMWATNRHPDSSVGVGLGNRSNYMIEERHTDQIDYNFTANISHEFNRNHRLIVGLNARVNRTEYYDKVKDLMGGDYWLDIDKFAERDLGSNVIAYQNDVDYYIQNGHPRYVKEGDKFSYDYYAHIRNAQLWLNYNYRTGGFTLKAGGEIGFQSMWRQGLVRKGLFAEGNQSFGNSKKLNYLTYKAKLNLGYRFNAAHSIDLGAVAMQNSPNFNMAFVSPRTRNSSNPGMTTEKIYSVDLTYNLNLPFLKARLSGFYTEMKDQSKVISFYDDTQSSFTNFAMSGIDKRYYGMELGLQIPIWNGLALQGALNYGNYEYTSNPNFVQTVDNSAEVKLQDKVNWKGFKVESTPQLALNVGLNWRAPKYWFITVDFNYYNNIYLSMNPAYRTNNAVKPFNNLINKITAELANPNCTPENSAKYSTALVWAGTSKANLQNEEKLKSAYTLNASIGKSWRLKYKYTIGFSAEVKNILNNQDIKTGGYEQMRMRRTRGYDGTLGGNNPSVSYYSRFDSKYFYMLGTTYYLNVYFRF